MSLLLLFTYPKRGRGGNRENKDRIRREQELMRIELIRRLQREDEELLILDNNSGSYYG